MKKQNRRSLLPFAAAAAVMAALLTIPHTPRAKSADPANKYETYRTAIKKEYGIDIRNYKEKLKGGRADGREITVYDLHQLLLGIKVEMEHASDRMTALEIGTDHLEELPDYYTRLNKMEQEARSEAGKGKKL